MTTATPAIGRSAFRRFTSGYGQEIIVALAIVVIFVVVSAINPRFLANTNVNSIIAATPTSRSRRSACRSSSSAATSTCRSALDRRRRDHRRHAGGQGYALPIAWGLPILVAIAINAFVGALVAYARIPSIVVTLGMLSILKGGLIISTGGSWISGMPPEFMIARCGRSASRRPCGSW